MKLWHILFGDPLKPLCTEIANSVNQAGCLVKPYLSQNVGNLPILKKVTGQFAVLMICELKILHFYIASVNKIAFDKFEEQKIVNFNSLFHNKVISQTITLISKAVKNKPPFYLIIEEQRDLSKNLQKYKDFKEDEAVITLWIELLKVLGMLERLNEELKNDQESELKNKCFELRDLLQKVIQMQESRMNLEQLVESVRKYL